MATTPVDEVVITAMQNCLGQSGVFGNPASQTHRYGYEAAELVANARAQIADCIQADPREIIFTSGATESDNLAIKGAAHFYQRQGKHIITMSTEHKAVLDSCHALEREGFEVTYLNPLPSGLLNLEALKAAIRSDTILISIMHVNNETGVIQDIAAMGRIAKEHGIIFHVDAAQSAARLKIDLQTLPVDLMSFSGHKVYGPKGIGCLYVRRKPRVRLEPQMHGGGHEQGLRSGTLPTHQIVGMGMAFALIKERREKDVARIRELRSRLWAGILSLTQVHLNGDPAHAVPGCLNITFDGVDGESLMLALRDLAISTGSACNSANPEASHVLKAMGLSEDAANRSLRICLGRYTTSEEVDYAIAHIQKQLGRLRSLSPLWQTAAKNAQLKSQPKSK